MLEVEQALGIKCPGSQVPGGSRMPILRANFGLAISVFGFVKQSTEEYEPLIVDHKHSTFLAASVL